MDLRLLAPELVLTVAAAIVVLLDAVTERKGVLPAVSIVGIVLAGGAALGLWGEQGSAFAGALVLDAFALFVKLLILAVAALVVLSSVGYSERFARFQGEYYALLLLVTAGLMLLPSANELITLFVALELTSIGQFVLAGFLRDEKAAEGSLKYLLLGAIATATFLFGMAIAFGLTGSTQFPTMATRLGELSGDLRPALTAAFILLAAGFGFKAAAVPFQMWVPDVYEAAPTPVVGFLSVASKAAGFAVLLRVFTSAFGVPFVTGDWASIFAVLALVSMVLGNVVAMQQSNIKRLMGYSTIAQAGYILIGLAAATDTGRGSVLFFLGAYLFTNLAAFAAITLISHRLESDDIAAYAGLARRSPWLAFGLALALVSLTGLPPTAGFWAKVYVFGAAVESGLAWLAIAGVINSVVSAYYYLRPVRAMYLEAPSSETPVPALPLGALALGLTTAGTVLLGLLPGPLLSIAISAGETLVR